MKLAALRNPRWLCAASALCSAILGYFYLERLEREVAGGPLHAIVALRADVPLGRRLTEADLASRELPERYLEERHVRAADRARVVGARATVALDSGSSLLWSDLDTAPAGKTLASLLAPGMRAFALAGAELTFDGLLRAGDRVDVLFTRGHEGTATTSILLQDLRVLSVGTALRGSVHEEEVSTAAPLVTLSISAAQVPLLAHAQAEGQLRLSLRHPRDGVIAEGISPATAADLLVGGRNDQP